MATATFRFNPSNKAPLGEKNQKTVRYFGTISFSAAGDVYVTGGLLPTANFALKNMGPWADRAPLAMYIESQSGSGWWYNYNVATGKLMILANAGSGTAAPGEVTNNTALNATTPQIATDVINFEAVFPVGASV